MTTVFLSYSTKDYFFAELAQIKLAEADIAVWRDKNSLIAGADWREGIETGISNSLAVLVALSENSAQSSYVTFEWAYGLGKGKPIIPLKLAECTVHPKLTVSQHLDFSMANTLPWESLIERIKEIETDAEPLVAETSAAPSPGDATVRAILAYLNQRGYQMASFDRIRRRIDEKLSDQVLAELVDQNKNVFRPAVLKGGKPGLAKLVP